MALWVVLDQELGGVGSGAVEEVLDDPFPHRFGSVRGQLRTGGPVRGGGAAPQKRGCPEDERARAKTTSTVGMRWRTSQGPMASSAVMRGEGEGGDGDPQVRAHSRPPRPPGGIGPSSTTTTTPRRASSTMGIVRAAASSTWIRGGGGKLVGKYVPGPWNRP